ncbi:hypothetical protein, partial [Vibrio casei]|uniref:hypothetical protein n=1 Tax=Vibrio casei TaxID=673372 RepID=UPI003F960B64
QTNLEDATSQDAFFYWIITTISCKTHTQEQNNHAFIMRLLAIRNRNQEYGSNKSVSPLAFKLALNLPTSVQQIRRNPAIVRYCKWKWSKITGKLKPSRF